MNRLQNEASPYLRQHAENPVDWYPWGPEAFALAQSENKPVLLSIGYSACHWCHVMAHESFEDNATAQVMNELFVNIKVDREERPDVDAIYMEAVQAMSGSGGWPMTVFMTPDAKPFFAGTYFPKEPTQGHPGFVSVLSAVSEAWATQQDEVTEQAQQLREAIADRVSLDAPAGAVDIVANEEQWTKNAVATATNEADMTWGGFGRAPKFPHVETLDLLLANNTTEFVKVSLDAMAAGGIYDQIGGGFSRYSVDAFWMVPHFEKMLYDNAGLVRVYLHAYQVTGEERFKRIVEETVKYVLRDLGSEQGAFFSAEDADSEGEEGKFYTWRTEEVREIIGNDETADAFIAWYGMTSAGNFEGSNILHRPNRDAWDATPEIHAARAALLEARSRRIRPGLDDKVLTEWNAMFIASLAEAGAAFGRPEWVERAETAMQFLMDNLRNGERWLRSWHSSTGAKQLAFASDYAWLINAFVSLREATGKTKYLTSATQTADQMIDLFWDEQHGGVFTSGSDAEALIVRAKDLIDSAYASTNGTAAHGLARVALLTGESKYREKAETIIALVAEPISAHPTAFVSYLSAVHLLGSNGTETVIAGEHPELVKAVHNRFTPTTVLTWGEPDATALWEGKTDGAYVCQNMACKAPTTDIEELMSALN